MTWEEFNTLQESDGESGAHLERLGTWKRQLSGGSWVLGRFYEATDGVVSMAHGDRAIEYRKILIEPEPPAEGHHR